MAKELKVKQYFELTDYQWQQIRRIYNTVGEWKWQLKSDSSGEEYWIVHQIDKKSNNSEYWDELGEELIEMRNENKKIRQLVDPDLALLDLGKKKAKSARATPKPTLLNPEE